MWRRVGAKRDALNVHDDTLACHGVPLRDEEHDTTKTRKAEMCGCANTCIPSCLTWSCKDWIGSVSESDIAIAVQVWSVVITVARCPVGETMLSFADRLGTPLARAAKLLSPTPSLQLPTYHSLAFVLLELRPHSSFSNPCLLKRI